MTAISNIAAMLFYAALEVVSLGYYRVGWALECPHCGAVAYAEDTFTYIGACYKGARCEACGKGGGR